MKILATSLIILQQLNGLSQRQQPIVSWTIESVQTDNAPNWLAWQVTEQGIGVVCPHDLCYVTYTGTPSDNHEAIFHLNHLIKRELDKRFQSGYGFLRMEYLETATTLSCKCHLVLFGSSQQLIKTFSYALPAKN